MANSGISLVLRETIKGWNSTQGDYVEYISEGTESAVIGGRDYAKTHGAIDVRTTTAAGEGAYRLIVRYNNDPDDPNAETPSVEFRMDPGRGLDPTTQPPYGNAGDEYISTHNLNEVLKAIANNTTDLSLDGLGTDSSAQELYTYLLRGNKYKVRYNPVFTLVRTASSNYNWPSQSGSIGTLYLANSVVAEVLAIAGSTPNFELIQETYINDSAAPFWNYGWLKQMPTYDTTIGNRTTESIDWEYGLWPQINYGIPS